MPSGISKTGAALNPPSGVETMSLDDIQCTVVAVPLMYLLPTFELTVRSSLLIDTSLGCKIPCHLARQNT